MSSKIVNLLFLHHKGGKITEFNFESLANWSLKELKKIQKKPKILFQLTYRTFFCCLTCRKIYTQYSFHVQQNCHYCNHRFDKNEIYQISFWSKNKANIFSFGALILSQFFIIELTHFTSGFWIKHDAMTWQHGNTGCGVFKRGIKN
jgi:hypothetical protein